MIDYIYRNPDDSIRVRIFRRDTGTWDADVFSRSQGYLYALGVEGAITYSRKRDVKTAAEHLFGPLQSMGSVESVTAGW